MHRNVTKYIEVHSNISIHLNTHRTHRKRMILHSVWPIRQTENSIRSSELLPIGPQIELIGRWESQTEFTDAIHRLDSQTGFIDAFRELTTGSLFTAMNYRFTLWFSLSYDHRFGYDVRRDSEEWFIGMIHRNNSLEWSPERGSTKVDLLWVVRSKL